MSRLVWLLGGLLGGVVVGRNAEPMAQPAGAAVVLALLVGCGLCWVAGYRGKSTAVATAVAHAQAVAAADAEANAAAIAQAAVHLHMSNSEQQLLDVDHGRTAVRSTQAARAVDQVAEVATARLWLPAARAR